MCGQYCYIRKLALFPGFTFKFPIKFIYVSFRSFIRFFESPKIEIFPKKSSDFPETLHIEADTPSKLVDIHQDEDQFHDLLHESHVIFDMLIKEWRGMIAVNSTK